MILKRYKVGEITFEDGVVDITDPCYSTDVWCRMNGVSVHPGKYTCYAYIGKDKTWGERIWILQIVAADTHKRAYAEAAMRNKRAWKEIGEIGVDSGHAGVFTHGFDMSSDEEWPAFTGAMFHPKPEDESWLEQPIEGAYLLHDETRGYGFFTSSGCGDGGYGVYAIRCTDPTIASEIGEIVALEIRF